jgi:hypothetical protein
MKKRRPAIRNGVKISSFGFTAGFGTLRSSQVVGLHRACPSATLDKRYSVFQTLSYNIARRFVKRD